MSARDQPVRWAILGTGAIAERFARALSATPTGELRAVGSSGRERARAVGSTWGVAGDDYAAVLARDDVDAVYVATVHPAHAELSLAALRAGKAVLCEKPAALDPRDLDLVLAAAESAGRPFVEAYKYRFSPLHSRLEHLVRDGAIGVLTSVEAHAGFAAAGTSGRLFDATLGGGARLDMGGYPVSLAVAAARWQGSVRAVVVDARAVQHPNGVDLETSARLAFDDGPVADVQASLRAAPHRPVVLRGTRGNLSSTEVWGDRERSGSEVTLARPGRGPLLIAVDRVDPFVAEADAVADLLARGATGAAEMPWHDSRLTCALLADWAQRAAAATSAGFGKPARYPASSAESCPAPEM